MTFHLNDARFRVKLARYFACPKFKLMLTADEVASN